MIDFNNKSLIPKRIINVQKYILTQINRNLRKKKWLSLKAYQDKSTWVETSQYEFTRVQHEVMQVGPKSPRVCSESRLLEIEKHD